MEFLDAKTIKLDRILSDLDKEVFQFISILSRHTDYVIVSGYVAILFGRTRTTEDVDVIIPEMNRTVFSAFFKETVEAGFWFLNSGKEEDVYELIASKVGVRAARDGEITPNFEVKFAKNRLDQIGLQNRLKVVIGDKILFTSPLEIQIAYKEKMLGSDKDLEDARHLRGVFREKLNNEQLQYYLENVENVSTQG
ncbi:hypothetical protein HYY74_00715 [Candidatus Woesearchaeota archaeon]|nr:hypothetical protein [Candidatus Woesearchaeota archaeon]